MIKKLVSVRLASLFTALIGGVGGGKSVSVGKKILFALLWAYVGAVFLGMSVFMAIFMGRALVPVGYATIYLALFASATFLVIFIFGIFGTKTELFDCKDNELLLSMPIKPRVIFLSRLFTVLVYNYTVALVLMLPAAIAYAVLSSDILGLIGTLFDLRYHRCR